MKRTLVVALASALALLSAGCPGKKNIALAAQKAQLGETKLREGDLDGALSDLAAAHRLDPKNADITHAAGLAYWARGIRASDEDAKVKAEALLLESFKQRKDVPGEWHNNLGALYVDMKRYGDAIKELEIAHKDPEYRTPYLAFNNEAAAYYGSKDCSKALEYANKSLQMQAKFCKAMLNRAQALDCLAKPKDAVDAYSDAIKECPENPESYLQRGKLLFMKLGKKTDAEADWKEARKRDPEGPVGKEAETLLRSAGH